MADGNFGSMITRADVSARVPQQMVRVSRGMAKPVNATRMTKAMKVRRPRTGAKGR